MREIVWCNYLNILPIEGKGVSDILIIRTAREHTWNEF